MEEQAEYNKVTPETNHVITKRQTTFKTVVKSTKKNGLEITVSRYSGANSMQSKQDMLRHINAESLVLQNQKYVSLNEIRDAISDSLISLFENKGIGEENINVNTHVNLLE